MLIPLPAIMPRRNAWSSWGGTRIAVGLRLNFIDDSPAVICTNTPIRVPLGAIWKMMFLLGSERSTLLTNIEGVPPKTPSESNVMLYQFTSPVLLPRELAAGVAGVVLVGSVWLRTVLRSKKTLDLPVAGLLASACVQVSPS